MAGKTAILAERHSAARTEQAIHRGLLGFKTPQPGCGAAVGPNAAKSGGLQIATIFYATSGWEEHRAVAYHPFLSCKIRHTLSMASSNWIFAVLITMS